MASKFLPSLLLSGLFISTSTAFDGDIHDFFLPNGLKVILMEKHASPKVAVGVFYNVGSKNEPDGQKGINQIVSSAILQGTEKYPSEEMLKKRDEFNASYGDNIGKDITYFYTEIPSKQLEFVLDYESDRMINVNIDAEMLSDIKDRYKTDLDEYYKNEIWVAFSTATSEIMPDGHPYKINSWGIPEQVDSLSITKCQTWYKNYFSPNNTVLVIVGDIIPQKITKLVYDYFGAIEPAGELPQDPDLSIEYINKHISGYELQADTEWMRFYGSAVTPLFFMPSVRDDDAIVLGHIEKILEISVEKRDDLWKLMSKNRRLFIDAEVDYFTLLGYSGFSIITLNVLRKGSENKIKKQILSTFEFIGENGVDNELLDQYKKSELLNSYENDYSYSKIARSLGRAELIMGDYHFYNRKTEILKQLTNEDIKEVAKKYFNKNNMQIVTIIINEKNWFTPFISFIANHIVLRFWDPEN